MVASRAKNPRKHPEPVLVARCVTRLIRRLHEAADGLDAEWARMSEGDKGEVVARLAEIDALALAAAELRARVLVRQGHGARVRTQRRRRRRKRNGNEFQAILREAARRCAAA